MNTTIPLPEVYTKGTTIGKALEEICESGKATIVIACRSRSYVLEQLIEYTQPRVHHEQGNSSPPPSPIETDVPDDHQVVPIPPKTDDLLQPTLALLAASSHVRMVFCPTIPAFRAYVSTLPVHLLTPEKRSIRVVVLDILMLHQGTSEFNVQGLSRSFSLVASMSHAFQGKVEMSESVDSDATQENQCGFLSWKTEVPLLSGSIKIGEAGQNWASRTISISKFANRWFQIR